MLFSYNWLKEYIENPPEPKELAQKLTMTGTEIESVTEAAAAVKGVITAQVLTVEKHPNADRLKLCDVKTDSETLSIVCGADNMKPGDKVALALPGAELPNNIKIKKSKIRGVESNGMMCSEVELGLKAESKGIMILPEDAPLGVDITGYLGLKDWLFEAGITPNRADLLGVKGLAREAAAVTGAVFKEKVLPVQETASQAKELVEVTIDRFTPCSRYSARVIRNVKIGPSPDFMKTRLEAHGLRPINNIVDITNYVLLETGHPLHAFDFDKVRGKKITVRNAREGEKIETLDSKVRDLTTGLLVIADAEGPIALAGVMGGKGSEVTDETKNIFLESAFFEPRAIRRATRRTGLSTDSSYRFERGADIGGVVKALDMAAWLMGKYASGEIAEGVIDIYPGKEAPLKIIFGIERIGRLLGIEINRMAAIDILRRLGMGVEESGAKLIVTPPTYRVDIKQETDLIEEIARLHGYDNIPTVLPTAVLDEGERGALFLLRKAAKDTLVADGFNEAINYSFISKEAFESTSAGQAMRILNPLTEEQSVMRESLIPSLLDNLSKNLARKNEEVRLFEFAPVYLSKEGEKLPEERWKVSGVMYGHRWAENWSLPKENVDFYDVKGVVEKLLDALSIQNTEIIALAGQAKNIFHSGKAASLKINGRDAGAFGEAHPDIMDAFDIKGSAYIFEIDVDELLIARQGIAKYRALPKFPESTRDIAFIVDEKTGYGEIIKAIKGLGTKIIERVELFDVYYGGNIPQGKKSMALRAVYRAMDRTLTQAEVDEAHLKLTEEIKGRFSADIRG